MKTKIIHEIDTDDLMKIIAGSDEEVFTEKLTEAGKFIYDLKIKQGHDKIPAELIYYTYKQWKGWDNKRQAKPQFFRDFKKYFTAHRTADGMCYLLNPKPFDLSQENYWLMRADTRNEKSKRSKKA